MDLPNDPRAAGFNSAEVRDALKFAMKMGLPEAQDERLTFRWRKDQTFARKDPAGRPYQWSDAPTSDNTPADVKVDGAVEFSDRSSADAGTPVTRFNTPRVVVTLLDVDYVQVETADEIILDDATYIIDYVAPPVGLFDMTVYQIYASAVDER